METVNKGPWHNLGQREEQIPTKSQDPRGYTLHQYTNQSDKYVHIKLII